MPDVKSFVTHEVSRGIREIFHAQLEIAEGRIYAQNFHRKRTGYLLSQLQAQPFSVANSGEGIDARVNLPVYIRFLDMKKKGNYQIYNRQVYGILYGNVLGRVKFGYEDFVRAHIGSELKDAAPKV